MSGISDGFCEAWKWSWDSTYLGYLNIVGFLQGGGVKEYLMKKSA